MEYADRGVASAEAIAQLVGSYLDWDDEQNTAEVQQFKTANEVATRASDAGLHIDDTAKDHEMSNHWCV